MAITGGDVQSVQNYFAMNELNTHLGALTAQLGKIPGTYGKLGKELAVYSQELANIKAGTGYGDLTDTQKDTFKKVNDTLKTINIAINMARANEAKRASAQGRPPNQKLPDSLDQMKRAVITSSASVRAYYKSSKVKGVDRIGLGDKNANIQASQMATQMVNNQRSASQATSDAITNLAESFRLKPTSNLSISPANLKVDTSNKATTLKQNAKASIDSIVPPQFSYLSQGLASLSKGLASMVSGISQFGGALGTAYSAIISGIGEMLDDPFSGVINIMKGMSALVTSAMSLISSLFDSIFNFISSILGSGSKDDEGGSSSLLGNLLSSIFSIISSLLSMAIQTIQSGFQMFTSTLEVALKLIKKIALSSPIVKAILELLNLAFTLFFMPFMNSFALVLLPYVLSLLEWATTMGSTLSELGTSLGNTLLSIFTSDDEIKTTFDTLVDTLVNDLLPDFVDLIPELTSFAVDFVNKILNNSESIIDFIKKGFEAFSALMDANILGTFLDIGKKTMQWLKDNAKPLVNFIAIVMTGLLKIASFFTKMVSNQTDVAPANAQFVDAVSDLGGSLAESLTSGGSSSVTVDDLSGSAITAGKGGIFRPMNGGIPVLTAEAGEGEFQLTDAELREIGKDTTVSIQYNGMILSKNDFKSAVRQTMTDISTRSYYR